MAERNFESEKNEIKGRSISPEKLDEIKNYFEEDIESTRLLSTLQSIDDIFDSLSRRDVINENNTNAFKSIVDILDDNTDTKLVNDQSMVKSVNEDEQSNYDNLREAFKNQIINGELQDQEIHLDEDGATARIPIQSDSSFTVDPKPHTSNIATYNPKEVIYKTISREIGRQWRDFGRGINMREGEMDMLEDLYPNNSELRVLKMFELFEEPGREDPKKHMLMICDAIDKCRRKNLYEKVREILTRNIF